LIKIYTDGACKENPGQGGAAAIIHIDNNKIGITSREEKSTNQRMEIKAIIIAIEKILETHSYSNEMLFDIDKEIEFYTDSAYVYNCINQKWYKRWIENGWINSKKEPVANRDLWEILLKGLSLLKEKGYYYTFYKVKGHSDDKLNEEVDKLAKLAVKSSKQLIGVNND